MFRADYRGKLPKSLRLYLLGDIHEGRIGVAHQKLSEAIEIIKADKNARWVGMGDMVESITPTDKRYSPYEQDGKFVRMTEQCRNIAKILDPISKQCLALLNGNHEEKHIHEINASDEIAMQMDHTPPSGGRTVKLTITDAVKCYLTHGAGAVNSMAGDPKQMETNDAIRIKRKLRLLQGDCIIMAMGHAHKLRIESPFPRLSIVGTDKAKQVYPGIMRGEGGFIPEDYRFYACTGSFLTGYIDGVTTYVERAMYPPTEIGMIKCDIQGDTVQSVEKVIL